ncbi:MAG: hypothetical protein H3Z53_11375 [archaeon]|nr:hypothetical protein [archaeon]MCP8314953.1 hypothetical protein [archaeon]
MSEDTGQSNKEDITREKVLKWAYDRYYNAKGISGQAFRITDAKKELGQEGLSSSEISRAVQFLSETNFLTVESRTYQTERGSVVRGTTYYRISYLGIEHIEGQSRFKRPEPLSGINVTNLGDVTVMGDGNIVQTGFASLYGPLDSIEDAVRWSKNLSDAEKREAVAEIRTIRSQLGKATPDKEITSKAWSRLKSFGQKVAIAAPYIGLAEKLLRIIFR